MFGQLVELENFKAHCHFQTSFPYTNDVVLRQSSEKYRPDMGCTILTLN